MVNKSYRDGDEPVPGYQLQEYLGRGGFGEVWQATGPGGVQVALKVIRDVDRKKGRKELRALRLLKDIRHPNLVPLTGFWLKDDEGDFIGDEEPLSSIEPTPATIGVDAAARGTLCAELSSTCAAVAVLPQAVELIIAMGLGERSLFDRLNECNATDQRGIPFEELLTYMEDAARAIDLLNTRHNIQHCDIKPQNILLLSGAAQVCDFGLATTIGDVRESSMGAGTIAYGAPEVLLGKGPCETTDQYSLAISYFELRSGQLPFGSERISDVLHAKQHGEVDLSALSVDERRVIGKAAAREAGQRFPCCVDMVRALRQCSGASNTGANGAALASTLAFRETRSALPNDTRTDTSRQSQTRNSWAAWGGLAVALIALAAALFTRSPSVQENGQGLAASVGEEPVATVAMDQISHNDAPAGESTGRFDEFATTQLPGPHHESVDAPAPAVEIDEPMQGMDWRADERGRAGDPLLDMAEASQLTAENTRQLADFARQTAESTAQIAETTRNISLSLDDIREELARAEVRGGLFEHPQGPSEFYHNARMFEQRGDYQNARRNYARFLSFRLNVVDPHLRYQRLLKVQDGLAAAREVYADIAALHDDPATQFASMLLEPAPVRTERLADFVHHHEGFAPAVYELSQEFSADRLGAQGLIDKAEERRLLEHFIRLVEEDQMLRYFLDHGEAIEMIEDAHRRLAATDAFDPETFENPIRVTAMMSNTSWTINLAIAEVAREIHYRLEGHEPFQSTGFNSFVDQRTGSPSPRPFFQLPLETPPRPFFVRYTDIRGNERGPFELVFDPDMERIQNGKRILIQFPHNWVSFREFNGRLLAYFTHVVGHRYALHEVRYSINSRKLDREFPLGAVDPHNPHAIPPDMATYISIPLDAKFVAVQLRFRDGTESEVQQFETHQAERLRAGQVERPNEPPEEATHQLRSEPPPPNRTAPRGGRPAPTSGGRRVLNRLNVDVNVDPNFRRAPRVRMGIGF